VAPDDGLTIPALVGMLQDADKSVRAGAAEALAVVGPKSRQAVPALRQHLNDQACWPRAAAAVALFRIDRKLIGEALPALLSAIKDPEKELSVSVHVAMMVEDDIPIDGDAVPALVDAVKDADYLVREAAVRALERIEPPTAGALPPLRLALRDPVEETRRHAVLGIGRLAPVTREVVPALLLALKDDSLDVRFAALAELGKFGAGASSAIPALRELQQEDPNARIREAAAAALKNISRGR
jgi:HEAT repeat protein